MKKVFTLALVMAIAITSFAQVKSARPSSKQMKSEKAMTITGLEDINANFVASTRSIMEDPEDIQLSQSFYDWQSNMGPRNYTAVWPDGFAVMCYTQATSESFTDRGTGLAIWDPAVGEWEYTETRVEGVKTGFGSIARYKENGLVVAAHTATDARIFIVEDFRQGNRNFGEGIALPVTSGVDPCWPVVQCSGENLDIINVLITNSGATTPCTDPIVFYQYANGAWTHQYEVIPNLDGDHMTDGGSNICYFMLYDPQRPNRVSFILNNAWSDGKLVISEDNGATWTERVFYQHPNIHGDFTDDWFFYPRWTGAAFDDNDKLHIVYEWNGSTETAGSGSYYPGIGSVAYWSEVLPKNPMCVGGIGNVGEPFIMDTTYMYNDIYASQPFWSDQTHEQLPENFGIIHVLDEEGNVLDWDDQENWPENYYWIGAGSESTIGDHGKYNNGCVGFASMHMDGNTIIAVWSTLGGDNGESGAGLYFDGTNHYFRLNASVSFDGGLSWEYPKALFTDFITSNDEMVYGQVIPYTYSDADGEYVWYCYMKDNEPGTCVQSDETVWDNNFYYAVKIYIDYLGVEENSLQVANMMEVYPNPAVGSFRVQLTNASDVNIYNAVGQLVKSFNNVKDVNVNLEAGVYFVNANNQTKKVIVK